MDSKSKTYNGQNGAILTRVQLYGFRSRWDESDEREARDG